MSRDEMINGWRTGHCDIQDRTAGLLIFMESDVDRDMVVTGTDLNNIFQEFDHGENGLSDLCNSKIYMSMLTSLINVPTSYFVLFFIFYSCQEFLAQFWKHFNFSENILLQTGINTSPPASLGVAGATDTAGIHCIPSTITDTNKLLFFYESSFGLDI